MQEGEPGEQTRIVDVLAVPAAGGYYAEDLAALQARSISVADRYTAAPVTPGFRAVREAAEAVSVGLVLDDGRVAWGDCVAVAYSGRAGRAPVFRATDGIAAITRTVAPALRGRVVAGFRGLATEIDALDDRVRPEPVSRRNLLSALVRAAAEFSVPEPGGPDPNDGRLHPAIRYGVSQALLGAAALTRGVTMAQVIAAEWGLPLPDAPVPIHAQSGGDWYGNADKMIVRRVASLPHVLVDNLPEQLGPDGNRLTQYARWLRARVEALGGTDYHPTIHLDVQGALGKLYDNNLGKVLGQIRALEMAVQPYPLRVESPVILDSRAAQIEALKTLCDYVRARRMAVQIVADEWANTLDDIQAFIAARAAHVVQVKMPDLGSVHRSVDAVLACRAAGIGAFLGGSCAETDLSARVSAHVALAVRPDVIMAKPGMGVDEGVMIVHNEMARTLAQIRAR